jgi:hypothetical protein
VDLFLFTCLLILPFSVTAKSVNWEEVNFKIDVPENWREVKDLYGIPVTLLGPSVSPKPRAVIQIIPTDAPPAPMSEKDAKAFGENYADGRKNWLKDQDAEILELLPGKFSGGKLSAGVSYRLNKKTYLERTYFVNCPKKLFHLKIILNLENRDELKTCESIVRSFACVD